MEVAPQIEWKKMVGTRDKLQLATTSLPSSFP